MRLLSRHLKKLRPRGCAQPRLHARAVAADECGTGQLALGDRTCPAASQRRTATTDGLSWQPGRRITSPPGQTHQDGSGPRVQVTHTRCPASAAGEARRDLGLGAGSWLSRVTCHRKDGLDEPHCAGDQGRGACHRGTGPDRAASFTRKDLPVQGTHVLLTPGQVSVSGSDTSQSGCNAAESARRGQCRKTGVLAPTLAPICTFCGRPDRDRS